MIYLFHMFTGIFFITVQSSVMPYFRIFNGFYDLLAVFVIYLGMHRPLGESLPVILFLGIVMDNLCGGPFGLYITVYLWILFGIRWVIGFLHIKFFFLLPAVVSSGVLMENVISAFVVGAAEPESGFFLKAATAASEQIFWAVCTGTVLLSFIRYIYRRLDELKNVLFIKTKGNV